MKKLKQAPAPARAMTPIEKALAARKAKRDAGEPEQRKNPIEKALANPGSRTLAINAKCYECMGCGSDPGWRRAIRECTSPKCPLHPFRPYQRQTADEDDGDESNADDNEA